MPRIAVNVPLEQIRALCQKWQVSEFSLFGSVVREDFGPDSDVDVLVTFRPGAPWSLYDLANMRDELMSLFGRNVDLIEEKGLRNPFRRASILRDKTILYAA
ncbi:MAG TPA: nucleotidyltransferase family protein [Tepidisphaeraceae bacterium]|jgi:predicted nucleotidyltransferase